MQHSEDGRAALWFARLTRSIHEALPPALSKLLPITFIGYAIINGSSFLLDMGILTVIGTFWHMPYGLLFSIGYGLASIYAFFMNRWLNFREHGNLGTQSSKYTAVIVSNYFIWILCLGSLFGYLGVQLQLARFMSACVEGIYVYLMLRFWVFPRGQRPAPTVDAPDTVATPSGALEAQ